MKIADQIAEWLAAHGIEFAFGIIGGGNVSLWNALATRGETALISCHHEQAAVMAAIYANRTAGRHKAIALVTTGAGSTNAITGVMAAWMDSIPLLVISGNEASHWIASPQARGFGVQGYDSCKVAAPFTKSQTRINADSAVVEVLNNALATASSLRPGPVWVDVPSDVQRAASH